MEIEHFWNSCFKNIGSCQVILATFMQSGGTLILTKTEVFSTVLKAEFRKADLEPYGSLQFIVWTCLPNADSQYVTRAFPLSELMRFIMGYTARLREECLHKRCHKSSWISEPTFSYVHSCRETQKKRRIFPRNYIFVKNVALLNWLFF